MGSKLTDFLCKKFNIFCSDNSTKSLKIASDVVYGKGYVNKNSKETIDLKMDVYAPSKTGSYPGVLFVHGGGFKSGSKSDSNLVNMINLVASKGFCCFSIDYRLVKNDPPAPLPWSALLNIGAAGHAATVDTKTAIRYIITTASQKFPVDGSRLSIVGESAGAVASIAAGVSEDKFNNDGVLFQSLVFPPIQYKLKSITSLWGSGTLVLNEIDSNDPPILIMHGTEDNEPGVSYLDSLTLNAQCDKVKLQHMFYPLKGFGHGAWGASVGGKPIAQIVSEWVIKFT